LLRHPDQDLTEILKDAPISAFVGISQSGTRDGTSKADVVKLFPVGVQAGFDIPQSFATSHLGISKTQKLIERGKASGPVVAAIATNTQIEIMPWQKLQQLPENGLT